MNSKKRGVAHSSLISLTWPIFVDLFFVFMVSAVDAWFLSRISDTDAAAVGAVLPLTGLGFTFFITLSYAGASIATQRIGASDQQSLEKTYGVLAQLFLIIGLAITAIYTTFATLLCGLLQLNDEMASIASQYLFTLGVGVTLLSLRYWASTVLSSQGLTRVNMFSTAIMTVTNCILNYAYVYGAFGFPALGVEGVAIASCLAWMASLIFSASMVIWYCKLKVSVCHSIREFKEFSRPILKIAGPSVLEPLSWHLSQIAIISVVVQLGELALATRVYAHNIIFIVAMFGTAISAGVQLKVAHYVGARDYTLASKELFSGLRLGLVGSVLLVSTLYLFSDQLFRVFTDNDSVIALGKKVILVAYLCECGRILNLVVGASLKAAGDAKYVSFMGFAIMWLVSVPLAWFLGLYLSLGLVGVWLALAVDELSRGMVAMFRWNTSIWQAKGVYANPTS